MTDGDPDRRETPNDGDESSHRPGRNTSPSAGGPGGSSVSDHGGSDASDHGGSDVSDHDDHGVADHDGPSIADHDGPSIADRDRTRDRVDDPAVLREELAELRAELDRLEAGVEERTVPRETVESDLKRYVRRRMRRGKARGWGPYLVLLYGTAMTIAAYYFLSGGWAILAMFVIWTSTVGVYFLMVIVGTVLSALSIPGRLRDRFGEWRS